MTKTEIERKFLVNGADWREQTRKDFMTIQQVYLVSTPEIAIRISNRTWYNDMKKYLKSSIKERKSSINIKRPRDGISRKETEIEIDWDLGVHLFALLRNDFPSLEKVRYFVDIDDILYWEIDSFTSNGLQHLTIAEVELPTEDYPDVNKPDWIGEEVTDDPLYCNAMLALQREEDEESTGYEQDLNDGLGYPPLG